MIGDGARGDGDAFVPRAIVGLGLVLFLAVPAQWLYFEGMHLASIANPVYVVPLFTAGVPALGVGYGGVWLARSDISPDRYPRVGRWCFGGLLGFLFVNLLLIAAFPAETLEMNVGWASGTAIFGAIGGLAIGVTEARAIERARLAERANVRARRAEVEREWLDYLNSLLRHEVLNTANVIAGQAALLENEYEGDGHDRLESIRRRSTDMTRVIEDVRVLIQATDGNNEFEPVNLVDVLESEVRALEDTYESVEVTTSVPADVAVEADDLLPRIFSNLLANAVEHHDGDVPCIDVRLETEGNWAVVEIEDDGPGVPEREQDTLFERSQSSGSAHGLGLYLVRTLVERYRGSVELVDTGSEGSTFRVELPRADTTVDGLEEAPLQEATPLAADRGTRGE